MSRTNDETGIQKATDPAQLHGELSKEQVTQMQTNLLIAQEREAGARQFEKMLRITTREAKDAIEERLKALRVTHGKAAAAVRTEKEVRDTAIEAFGDNTASSSSYFASTVAAIQGVKAKATLDHETIVDWDENIITVTETLNISDSPEGNYRTSSVDLKKVTEHPVPAETVTLQRNVANLEDRRLVVSSEITEWEQKLADMPFLKERMIDWADAKELADSGAGDSLKALQAELTKRLGLGS